MAWKHFKVPVDGLEDVTGANKVWLSLLRQLRKRLKTRTPLTWLRRVKTPPSGTRLQRTHSCLHIKAGQRAGRWSRGPKGREMKSGESVAVDEEEGILGPDSQLNPLAG